MRIIGGSARGRRIEAPKGLSTRPTTDRVRESLFGILQFRLASAVVLDLFCGSGALALESLSRGADCAVLNDADRTTVRVIEQNVSTLGFSQQASVHCMDYAACLRHLAAQGRSFDLIFLDPPYGKGLETDAVRLIARHGLLKPGGRVVIEHAAKDVLDLPAPADRRQYGDTCISFLEDEQLEDLRLSGDV